MLAILGFVGGMLALYSTVPYIIDILKKKIKPQRTTFFIWFILGSIAFFSQLLKGASSSLWLPGVETLGSLIVFIISIKYGVGGLTKKDFIALSIAAFSLLMWYFTKEAAIAVYLVILVDASGLFLTLHKTYLDPSSEKPTAWLIAAIGGLLTMLSIGSWNIILLSYPFYILLANLSVIVAIYLGERRMFKFQHRKF